MLTRAFPLPLPGRAVLGMAVGERGLWVPIRLHPWPGGRRAPSKTPRGCGHGPAALLLPARGLERGQSCPAGRPGLLRTPRWGSRAGPASAGAANEAYVGCKLRSFNALSNSLGERDIIQARLGCLNSVRVSSGGFSLRIASCPLSGVLLFSNIVALDAADQERL